MIVYHAHDKFFIPNMKEVDLATVIQWQEQGVELQIEEGEQID